MSSNQHAIWIDEGLGWVLACLDPFMDSVEECQAAIGDMLPMELPGTKFLIREWDPNKEEYVHPLPAESAATVCVH